MRAENDVPSPFDSVALAVLNRRFESITSKMANTLLRAGRSGVLNIARDFSTSIVTGNSELLTGSESLPIHFLRGADLMCGWMKKLEKTLERGDAFLHNSPYHGCSHAGDLTVLVPVIDEDGRHQFTVWVKAHQADIGNSQPTTYMGHARDVYEEGAIIFPVVRVQRNYEDIPDLIRMCKMRIRVPEQWYGDYLAMIGAARIGEQEILALAKEFGWEQLHSFEQAWFDYSERMMVSAIKKLPSGTAVASSTHDPLPGTPSAGVQINARVKIDSQEAVIDVDLTDNPDVMPNGLNVSEACSLTGAMIGIFNSIGEAVPTNEGSFRRIRTRLRDGCCIGGGKHPTSMSAATTNLADRVTNAVQIAFSKLKDGLGMAECGAHAPGTMGVLSGTDPRNANEAFINQIYLFNSGGAASPGMDAWLTVPHAGNAGMCLIDSVELDELRFPIVIAIRKFLPDTEGAGRTIGSPGGLCEFGPIENCSVRLSFVVDGCANPALGVLGGYEGAKNRNFIRKSDGALEEHSGICFLTIGAGERVVSYTPGGGGYGPPYERAIERVRHGVKEGMISSRRAADVYGVVFTATGEVDPSGTKRARQALARKLMNKRS